MKKIISILLILSIFCSPTYVQAEAIQKISYKVIDDQLDLYLQDRFQLIDTNIPGTSLSEKIDKAQVVLLLETHIEGGGQIPNAQLIDSNWRQGDRLLLEGNFHDSNISMGCPSTTKLLSNPKIAKDSASWDLLSALDDGEEIADKEFELLVQYSHLIIELAKTHLPGAKTDDSAFDELVDSILSYQSNFDENSAPPQNKPDFSKYTKEMRFDYLLSLIPIVIENGENTGEISSKITVERMLPRNQNMVETIRENLQLKGYQRVWVIAGAFHGRYGPPEDSTAVAYLYDNLQNDNIPYVTLHPRKVIGERSQREIEGKSLNDPNATEEFIKEYNDEWEQRIENWFLQWELETQDFQTSLQWSVWICTTIANLWGEFAKQSENSYFWEIKLDCLHNYCFEKIVKDKVLKAPVLSK